MSDRGDETFHDDEERWEETDVDDEDDLEIEFDPFDDGT
jgi:hypothetical protein